MTPDEVSVLISKMDNIKEDIDEIKQDVKGIIKDNAEYKVKNERRITILDTKSWASLTAIGALFILFIAVYFGT